MQEPSVWQKYESERVQKAQKLSSGAFRRHYGVKHHVFYKIVEALQWREWKKKKAGRQPKLNLAEQALFALEYWREYPTLFHHSYEWGLDEKTGKETVARVEKAMLASGRFRLDGKKSLRQADSSRLVLVDATESPVERPKKNSADTILVRKSATLSRLSWSWTALGVVS